MIFGMTTSTFTFVGSVSKVEMGTPRRLMHMDP
jgi:hypothetical protein